jgi:hypothetical protein
MMVIAGGTGLKQSFGLIDIASARKVSGSSR